jgi:acyl-CoA reductase-like NAD-dependent aldehyde dehydrogenase
VEERRQLFIGGEWTSPSGDARLEVISPHTEKPIAAVAAAGPADVDRAVAAARFASTAGGRKIAAACGASLKKVSLELGGKSAAVVLDDADPTAVAEGVKLAGLMNNGQACVAQTRILVPEARKDEFTDALASMVEGREVGDPEDPATEIGPLVAERQQKRVRGYIEDGQREGARMLVGDADAPPGLTSGWYVRPTLFADVDNGMKIAREEIFGPVLSVISYRDDDEAVSIANDSDYGLSGSVWTADAARGLDVARRVRTGSFGVNQPYTMDPAAPFGGIKASGIGRELGREGLEGYVDLKAISGASLAG